MDHLLRWFYASPHRGLALNILMMVVLLVLVDSGPLFAIIGSLCLIALGLAGLRRAVRESFRQGAARLAFDRLAVWLPGAAALALCALGLHLVVGNPAGSAAHAGGVVLFAFELVILALPGDGAAARAET